MASQRDLNALQKQIWDGSIPLEIRLASTECRTYDDSDPYIIQVPRLSYIPFLLPRLHAFFAPALIDPSVPPTAGYLTYDSVPLKWHHPLGLLYDLYSGAEPSHPSSTPPPPPTPPGAQLQPLPWRLTAHFATPAPKTLTPLDAAGLALHDAFTNAIKEADFLRNGSARAAMSLPKDASDRLWAAVRANDMAAYNAVHTRMLLNVPGQGPLRHVPLKLYLPGTPPPPAAVTGGDEAEAGDPSSSGTAAPVASLRVVQALVTPTVGGASSSRGGGGGAGGQQQTLGTALNGILPSLFPSRRSPLLAQPVLHGAVVPLGAPVEDLSRAAAYADGFLHVAIVMMG